MEISVAEASQRLGLSISTVRRLAGSGEVSARKVAGSWLVADSDVASFAHRRREPGRPVSARSAWAILALLAGQAPVGLSRSEVVRARQRARIAGRLAPGQLAARAQMICLQGPHGAISRVLEDQRLVRSGASASKSAGLGIVAPGMAEGYVRATDIDAVLAAYHLRPAAADAATVILWVPAGPWPFGDAAEAPVAVSALDLLDSGEARSVREARRVLDRLARRLG